ncbi:MAG: GTP-binding protein [Methanomassiliicoccales archaeon]|nr:MAG: GTP-binding protein [Methanomassiliicoccales archaeon]
MATIEDQIKEIQAEIDKTQVNKKTEYHLGKLKAKIARLKIEAEKRRSQGGGTGRSYGVKKSGNATVALVGFPSVGKSTMLNRLTDAKSEVGSYDFTTLDVIPGIMEYKGAKIQVLDLPGLIRDASKGKGRGREVLSVVRSADLILFVMDPYDTNIHVLVSELETAGIRLNTRPPDVVITRRDQGGIDVKTTVELTKMTEEYAKEIVMEYGHVSADVVIREDINVDQLIDVLAGNRIYMKAIMAVNKVDTADPEYLEQLKVKLQEWHPVFISAQAGIGLEELKEAIFKHIDLIRVYLKKQGQEADLKEPLIVRRDSTVGDVCDSLHRVFRQNFRYATVWGKSAKFPGQMVGLDHVLQDGDILSIIIRRTGE